MVSQVSMVNSRTPTPSTSTSPIMRAITSPAGVLSSRAIGQAMTPAPRIRPDIGPDTGVGRHQPPTLGSTGAFGEGRTANEGQGGPAHHAWAYFTPFKRPRRIDRLAQQDRKQHHGSVHDDEAMEPDVPPVR